LPKDSRRTLIGRIGAHALHAKYDSRQLSAPGRAAFMNKFEQGADPNGVLSPEERARRAQHLRKLYFARLALRSADARRKKAMRKRADVSDTSR
jgi:hypothetical protein